MPGSGNKYGQAIALEYFTVGYNILEAIVSILAGKAALSIALVGFGLDSVAESLSALVMLWRLRQCGRLSAQEEEKAEKKASRLIGVTFWLLGLYVFSESLKKILDREVSRPSLAGIIIAALSLLIMPPLAFKKNKLGKTLGLPSLVADAKETMVCAFLSLALLIGLLSRSLFGFWLADPLVGLLVVIFLVSEGYELLFEKG